MKLVVLDRDGVINFDSRDFIKSPEEWRPIPGSLEAIARLTQYGFLIAVATNQSGLARGLFDGAALAAIHQRLQEDVTRAGGRIAHIAFCPHGPDEGCACRKPLPGLIDEIFSVLGRPRTGWMVGDRPTDIAAGAARGLRPILVGRHDGNAVGGEHVPVVTDLADAAAHILAASRNPALANR